MIIKGLGRSLPSERLAGAAVERSGDGLEIADTVPAQVGALREVLAQQAIRVLVRAALPWAVRVAEVDRYSAIDAQLSMLRQLGALIPGERSAELLREDGDRGCDGVADRLAPCPARAGPL